MLSDLGLYDVTFNLYPLLVFFSYWYDRNICLYPNMATVSIAVDVADRHNGCVQVRLDKESLSQVRSFTYKLVDNIFISTFSYTVSKIMEIKAQNPIKYFQFG